MEKNFGELAIFNFWQGKHWRMLDPVVRYVRVGLGLVAPLTYVIIMHLIYAVITVLLQAELLSRSQFYC